MQSWTTKAAPKTSDSGDVPSVSVFRSVVTQYDRRQSIGLPPTGPACVIYYAYTYICSRWRRPIKSRVYATRCTSRIAWFVGKTFSDGKFVRVVDGYRLPSSVGSGRCTAVRDFAAGFCSLPEPVGRVVSIFLFATQVELIRALIASVECEIESRRTVVNLTRLQ